MERQNTFGWLIAIDIFLGGAGGGAFLISFILESLHQYEPLTRVGVVAGPILVLLGTAILFFELGVKSRPYCLFYNMSSWMARGSLCIVVFTILGLVYSVPAFWLPDWGSLLAVRAIGIIATIFSLLVAIYPGFLFGIIRRIPFWNRGALPLLFLLSSFCSGIAILLLIAPFTIETASDGLYYLAVLAIALILMHSFLIVVFLEIASQEGTTGVASVRLLRKPLFIVGVVFIGLIIPLALLSCYAAASTSVLLFPAGILLLAGNLLFRYSVLKAGVRLPLYPP